MATAKDLRPTLSPWGDEPSLGNKVVAEGLRQLNVPGQYLRGVLAGKPGATATTPELLAGLGVTNPSPLGNLAWDVATDPLTYLGPGLLKAGGAAADALRVGGRALGAGPAANPLQNALTKLAAEESGALKFPPGPAVYTPQEVQAAADLRPRQLTPHAAGRWAAPWIKALSPEERAALQAFTGSEQARISHAYRGASSGGYDPFEGAPYGGGLSGGIPPLVRPADVHAEVAPYLESALSRSRVPSPLMTYRMGRQVGRLEPATAEKMLGRTVTDLSPLSTAITPWDRYYGRGANPQDLLLDLVLPKGTAAGYVDPFSRFTGEKELLLPGSTPWEVAGVRDVPVVKMGGDWVRLGAGGRPIPQAGASSGSIFPNYDATQAYLRDLQKSGGYGTTAVPDEILHPEWRDRIAQGQAAFQKNVLLKAGESPMPPHEAMMRRWTPQELAGDVLQKQAGSGIPLEDWMHRYLGDLIAMAQKGTYPEPDFLRKLEQSNLLPAGYSQNILRSIPAETPITKPRLVLPKTPPPRPITPLAGEPGWEDF